jgi:eukaryotic-like serine/threonine-protein kinase
MNNNVHISAIGDGPVEAALADYFDRLDRGTSIELPQIIAAHPGCETGFLQFLNQERKLHAVTAAALTPTANENLTGRALGDFRLRRIIGRGGMGVVWEAEQLSLGRKVAVKLLPGALCSDPRHRSRFQNEARMLAQLEHPNIVNVIAVGEEADALFFAMQYVDGMTVDDLIRDWGDQAQQYKAETPIGGALSDMAADDPLGGVNGLPPGQSFPWIAACAAGRERYRTSARIAAEVADGLVHAHACGVLHRDVKPSNILLDKNGTARLTDFGLARMYGDATLTVTGTILGTLRYASPEQLRASPTGVDERSDVYSLGVTLWELVTGRRLYRVEDRTTAIAQILNAEVPRASLYNAQVPRDLETVIARAAAKEPADRYASAQAFADDLRRFLDGRPILAKPISLGERAFRWANRNRVLTASAVGSLVVLAAVALVASALILQANSRTAAALHESQFNEDKARRQAGAAEASAREAHELLYAADISLAGAAWQKNEPAQVRMLLERYATPTTRGDSPADDPRGFEWYFLERQISPSTERLFQNEEALFVVQFTDGGQRFLTAGKDGIVRWHDSGTGKVVRSLNTQQREVNCVSISPSAKLLATAGDDGTVKIWDLADMSLRWSIKAYDGKCFYAKFLDDESVISGGRSKVHRLYSATSGKLVREYASPLTKLTGATQAVTSSLDAHVSKGGERFWTTEASDDRRDQGAFEWDVATGKSRQIFATPHPCHVLTDSSEKYLIVNSDEGQIRVLDRESGKQRQSFRIQNRLEALAVSPDDRLLVAGDRNGQLSVWNLELSAAAGVVAPDTPKTFSVHNGVVYAVAVAPDGESLVTAGHDGSVRRTRIDAVSEPFHELRGLKNLTCCPIPGTEFVVTTPPLCVRERSTGKIVKTLSTSQYTTLATDSYGTLVAAGSGNQLAVWNLATDKKILNLDQKRRWTTSIDFSSDNSLLGVNSNDGEDSRIDIVDISTGTIERVTAPGSASRWSYFCGDDGLVGWLSTPGQLVCWNVRDWSIRWETKPLAGHPGVGAISPDRKWLLTADQRVLSYFDSKTGEVRYRAPCAYPVKSLAFAGDGRSFVTGGEQGQLSVWRAATGQFLFEMTNVGTAIESIQPLRDGFMVRTQRVKDGRTEDVWLEF